MASTANQYQLTASDLDAFPALLSLQNTIGPAMPAFADSVAAFKHQLDGVSGVYGTFKTPLVKSWIDQFFANLEAVDTSYASRFPWLYLAYRWGCYWVGTANDMEVTNEDCFQSVAEAWTRFLTAGPGWSDDCVPGIFSNWPRPGAPASWSQVINQTGLAAEGAQ